MRAKKKQALEAENSTLDQGSPVIVSMRVKDVPRYMTTSDGRMELEVPEPGTSSSSTARIKDEAEETEKEA